MQINNPFQMNDWEIKKFLKVVLAVQLIIWGVIGLDAIGLQIPILRLFIGFIYLTFIPGILILRIFKLHKLGNIETLLYTVGLSIATLMFTGFFMNTLYPFFGISGPISLTPLIITISVVVLILCVLCYVRDKDFSDPSFIDIKNILSPPALFLCMIPFLAVLGTYMVNFHHNNILLMFLIVIIAIITILIAFDKFIPKNLYPLAVFVIAISLLFHNSLISMYLCGADIFYEHYISSLVITNSLWDLTLPCTVNAMLSIVMLAPIFSNICSMSLTWVFKIIYPLLFSLVPLGLYRVFQKQTDSKIAFLSCFFFTSGYIFYTEMLGLLRQQIAELFLVLMILSMIDKNMNKIKRSFLFIIFGVSLAVSHYGLSYIYMFSIIAAWLILVLAENPEMQKLTNNFYSKFGRKREKLALAGNPISSNIENRTLSSTFVLLFITFTLTWYMYVSSSLAFNAIVGVGDHIASSIFIDFLKPEAVQGLGIMLTKTKTGLLYEIYRIINYLNQIFIIIGCIVLLLKYREMKFEREYAVFSMLYLVLLFACISVPNLTAVGMTRTHHISLIFLAPFCVIGGITVFGVLSRVLSRVLKGSWTDKNVRSSLKVLSVYFVIVLLYSTGFVWEITDDHPVSISLSQDKPMAYRRLTHEQDMPSAGWLSAHRKNPVDVYAVQNSVSFNLLYSYGFIPLNQIRGISVGNEKIKEGTYAFLDYTTATRNICPLFIEGRFTICSLHNTTFFQFIYNHKNKIYNSGCEIYYN